MEESKERESNGRFKPGNQVAVKWTDETVIPELEKILSILENDDNGLESNNPVRANDIKFVEEAVMCAGVNLHAWEYWNTTKFQDELPNDSSVFMLIKKIKKICEYRLGYAGQVMDIFMLKNHYNYKDKTVQEQDIKAKVESTNTIELSKLSTNTVKELLALKRGERS